MKRTFQPNVRKRAKRHGFRHRMATRAGRAIIKARRRKGRLRLSARSTGSGIRGPSPPFVPRADGCVGDR